MLYQSIDNYINGYCINQDSKGTKSNFTEKDFIELRNEKNDLPKSYKNQMEELQKLIDEKDKLMNVIENLKFLIDKNNSEKEKFEHKKKQLKNQKNYWFL